MMNDILNQMDADELRNLVKHQEDAIRAYQGMVFEQGQVIGTLETLYRQRVNMDEARRDFEVAIGNLRYLDDRLAEKYGSLPVCTCEAESR